jgi:hypothetical protein
MTWLNSRAGMERLADVQRRDVLIRTSAQALVDWLDLQVDVIGTGEEPDGLCDDRDDHRPHLHDSPTLGRFWCTADQDQREPYRSERRRRERAGGPS